VCGIVTAVARRWVSVGGYFWWRGGGIALISRLRERGDGCLQKGGKLFLSVPNPPPISFRYKHTSHPVFPSNRVVYFAKVTSHFATPLPNIPTLKWQRLVMIYGPNFILFLFFFFFFHSGKSCAASLPRSSTPPPPYIMCVVQFMLFSCIPEHVYPAIAEHTSRVPYIIIIWPRRVGRKRVILHCGRDAMDCGGPHTRGYIATDG